MNRGQSPSLPQPLDPNDFPVLADFLVGYLHQDFLDDFESPEAAVADFLSSADEGERRALVQDWRSFRSTVQGWPFEAVVEALTEDLGSGWQPLNQAELEHFDSYIFGR